MNIFDVMYEDFKFDKDKPIKLFEAFAGYGSQYMALKRLGVNVEVVGYSEIDKFAIKVYEALHGKHKNYGAIGSFDRLPPNIDICTWSFPCQDISLAGKQKGMIDGSRSNYGYVFLDTVEATPYHERPKVLLMENVRALFSEKFIDDWREIQLRLERMGYTNHADILNAKDYGVAQNRERVFIVSVLGEYNYTFPKPIPLTKRLKDYLEDEVDEKYYLSATMLSFFIENSKKNAEKGNGFRFKPHEQDTDKVAFAITTNTGNRMDDNFIKVKTWNEESKVYKTKEEDMPRHRIYDTDSIGFTITTNESQQPSIIIPESTKLKNIKIKKVIKTFENGHQLVELENGIGAINTEQGLIFIRKLTPRESLRLMDVSEHDIDIITSKVSNAQAYKLAGNSIVVSVLEAIFRQLIKEE